MYDIVNVAENCDFIDYHGIQCADIQQQEERVSGITYANNNTDEETANWLNY